MNYARLLQDAWTITWRHRFLWILGLFAGSGASSCSGPSINFNFPINWVQGGTTTGEPTTFEPIIRWFTENAFLIVALVVALFLVGLLFLIISLIAQGGMARATADLALGRPSSLDSAVRAGVRLFWRYFGLWLILFVATIAIMLVMASLVAMGILLGSLVEDVARVLLISAGVFLALLLVLAAIPVAIIISIIVAYAQRAIAVEDVGPISALRSGATLFRNTLGPSLIIWLINVAVSIVIGIVTFILAIAIIAPLVAIGVGVYFALGLGAATIIYAVIAGLLVFVIFWLLSAVTNTYIWTYWTLAYLRLTSQAEPAA